MALEHRNTLQKDGPLQVISRVIHLHWGEITPLTHIFSAISGLHTVLTIGWRAHFVASAVVHLLNFQAMAHETTDI